MIEKIAPHWKRVSGIPLHPSTRKASAHYMRVKMAWPSRHHRTLRRQCMHVRTCIYGESNHHRGAVGGPYEEDSKIMWLTVTRARAQPVQSTRVLQLYSGSMHRYDVESRSPTPRTGTARCSTLTHLNFKGMCTCALARELRIDAAAYAHRIG